MDMWRFRLNSFQKVNLKKEDLTVKRTKLENRRQEITVFLASNDFFLPGKPVAVNFHQLYP